MALRKKDDPKNFEPPKRRVRHSNVNYTALDERKSGSDFKGNLTEFQIVFEWIWETDSEKSLFEKAVNSPFTGWIHIIDNRLDSTTYPGQEQKIKFEEGKIKFTDSLD